VNHPVGVNVPHRVAGERPGLVRRCAEVGTLGVGRDAGGVAALTSMRLVWFGSMLVGLIGAVWFLVTVL
jgi:hypothetical protein